MAMPKSTPRRPGKPGQNRDSRDGVFGHLESQVGPLPRVGLYARVSTLSITKVYPPPRHQGNSPILGDIIISSLSGFVGFGWENFSQPVSSLEV